MGRKIGYQSELPAWFSLARYKVLNDLSHEAFRRQMMLRRELLATNKEAFEGLCDWQATHLETLESGPIFRDTVDRSAALSGFLTFSP